MLHIQENGAAVAAGLLLAGFLSGGCILFQPYVRDLKLSRIEPAFNGRAPRSNAPQLRFFFTTSRDLADLGAPGVPRMDVGLCPSAENSRLYVHGPYLDGRGMWDLQAEAARNLKEEAARISYEYEALFTYDPDLLFDEPSAVSAATPDLCFRVSAGSYFGAGGFDSRPAVIPGTAIDAALASAVGKQ